MMRRVLATALSLCVVLALACAGAATPSGKPLQIYFIDVEGGQATLLVSPSGESLLIDTGWPGYEGRDADRILAAAHQAGLKQIDYVLTTHYHRDHAGGRKPLGLATKRTTYRARGTPIEDSQVTRADYKAYEKAIAGHAHVLVKPGWELPIKGIQVRVISAAGEHVTEPLPG